MTGSAGDTSARVLLVEDDRVAALFTVTVLSDHGGFTVIHETDPKAALRTVTPGAWDLMITDIEMPGMTGIELLERVREIDPLLPVAVVTAHVTVGNAVGALRGSADEFLEKPLRPAPLVETVTALVAKGREARLAGREVVLAIGAHPDDARRDAGPPASYEQEVRSAVRYERAITVKAAVPLALVALVIEVYLLVHG